MTRRSCSGIAKIHLLAVLFNGFGLCAAGDPEPLPLVFTDEFESGAISHWKATDPTVWRLAEHNGQRFLQQFARSDVQTPVRSPFNRSLVSDLRVGDFQLDVDVRSTARDYGHRDVCLFFGYQDQTHFYYVHLGQRADDHANQIFIVNEAPRVKISTQTTEGTPWDSQWHHVRIVRDADSGEIAVYFDDMTEPVMKATDTTFTWGTIGVGTFDDTGDYDNVQVRGVRVERPAPG